MPATDSLHLGEPIDIATRHGQGHLDPPGDLVTPSTPDRLGGGVPGRGVLEPWEALGAATWRGRDLLGEPEAGVIREGGPADFSLVDGARL